MSVATRVRSLLRHVARSGLRPLLVLSVLLCALSFVTALGRVVCMRAARGKLVEPGQTAPLRSVVIVPGALVYRSGRLSHTVEDRVACARALYAEGRVQRVLVSGDHGARSYDEVWAMGRALVLAGVPEAHVFLDHAGFRTLDTMQRARRVFGVRDAAICTQRFHLPRSLYLAEQSGIDAIGVVADRRRYAKAVHNEVREVFARAAAWLDVRIGREARRLGAPVDIRGDGRVTQDGSLREVDH